MNIEKLISVTDLDNSGSTISLSVTIKSSDFEQEVENQIQRVAKSVKIDGFRSGKVPVSVVKKRYSESVKADVLQDMIVNSLQHIQKTRELRMIGQPDVTDLVNEPGKDVSFKVKCMLFPKVTMPEWEKFEIEKPVLTVSEKDVEEEIDRLIKSSHEFTEKTKDKAKIGDQVVIDTIGYVDNTAFEGGKLEKYRLVLGSGTFIPGFEDQLVGAKEGEEVKVSVKFPEEYHAKNLAGKDAIFECVVSEVYKPTIPELNDEFAKKFDLDSLEELKEKIKANIAGAYGEHIFAYMKRKLFDAIENSLDFPVPEALLEEEKSALKNNKPSDEDDDLKDKSEEEKELYYNKLAVRRVKLGFLLAEYAKLTNISVTQDDLQRTVLSTARQFPGQELQILDFYHKNMNALESLKGPIIEEKSMKDIIENKVKTKEKKYTKEKLEKLLEE